MRMRKKKKSDRPDVAMSPLIDCVFLLLIFFLVATMYKKEDRDIDITPPESASAQKLIPDDETLVIGIDTEGGIWWQGEAATRNEVHQRLSDLSLVDPGRRIRLDADAGTAFWRVAEVMDMCQFRGMTNVGIRTYDERYNRR